jgi:hypothetical protein
LFDFIGISRIVGNLVTNYCIFFFKVTNLESKKIVTGFLSKFLLFDLIGISGMVTNYYNFLFFYINNKLGKQENYTGSFE